jgi:lipopolysaccharide/colanic/teichoic acid biosynthesis glycosyltransferase
MELHLPTDKIIKTYQRFSLPIPSQEPVDVKKLEFFYIGTQVRHISKLTDFFEFGYTTISPDQAIFTLKRLLKRTEDVTIPDVIIVEAGIGIEKLMELHRFISGYKILADMPFIVEGTGLSRTAIAELKRHTFIDEILFMTEFAGAEVAQKVKFVKKVKQNWVHQPATCSVEKSFPLFPDLRSFFKRVLDIAITASLLLVLSPVMLLLALAIKLDSNGPVLQASKRIGRGYKPFDLLKFRTTVSGDHEDDPVQLSRMGLVLQKTGLNDLPQLLNVLMGDLSLVGSRPLTPTEAAKLTTDYWSKRFLSPAGITGLWQFKKEKELLPVEECQSVENGFADQPDLLYDLWVIANRPPAMVQERNA